MMTGNAFILGHPLLDGFRLTCYNAWYYYGKHDWKNLTLAFAPLAAHSEGMVEANRSDALWMGETGIVPEAIELQTTYGGHVVSMKSNYPFAYFLNHAWTSTGLRLEDQTDFFYLDCGATSSEQLDNVTLLIDLVKTSPAFSIRINLEESVPHPFDFMYASSVYKLVMAVPTYIMLIISFLGFKYLIEHWKHGRFLSERHLSAFRGAKLVWTVLIIESFSLLLLAGCEIATVNHSRASPLFTREIIMSLFTYLMGTSLFTTILVWKYWGIVLAKINRHSIADASEVSGRSCSALKFYVLSLFFLLVDIVHIVLTKLEIGNKMPLLYALVMPGILSLSTLVAGILYMIQARKILNHMKQVATLPLSTEGNEKNDQSSARVAAERLRNLSKLGRMSGIFMILAIIGLVWCTLDPSVLNIPVKYAVFRFIGISMRTGISASQILICRLPPRMRKKSTAIKTFSWKVLSGSGKSRLGDSKPES